MHAEGASYLAPKLALVHTDTHARTHTHTHTRTQTLGNTQRN